jgi:EAL domain-containing protein (putative c-di-GMP-specific phosphodiesterase class I)
MLRLLCVQSQPKSMSLVLEGLSAVCHEVLVCEDVEAAKTILSRFSIDLVLTDLVLYPIYGFDGIRLTYHIRTFFPQVRTVGVYEPGTLSDAAKKEALQAGAVALFEKPFDLNAFNALLNEQFSHKLLPSGADLPLGAKSIVYLPSMDHFVSCDGMYSVVQPIVVLDDRHATSDSYPTLGLECLARTKDLPSYFSPELLFNYAALRGRFLELDLACLKKSLQAGQMLPKPLRLFINVRPRSLANPRFIEIATEMTAAFGFAPQEIVWELTEQQALLNEEAANQTVMALKARGFGVALDDFGVGFANMKLLHDIKPDFLKVSGFFSHGIHKDPAKQALMRLMIEAGNALGVRTIVESVESQEELEAMKAYGAYAAQGYLFCRPEEPGQLAKLQWLKRHPIAKLM